MAKTQITTAAEAASLVKDGMTVMVGGFMANGTPEPIIDELVKSNVKDLTIICNLSLIHISEPTRPEALSRMPSSA